MVRKHAGWSSADDGAVQWISEIKWKWDVHVSFNLFLLFQGQKIFDAKSSIVWQKMWWCFWSENMQHCSSAMNFENQMEMKHTCVNQFQFAVSKTEKSLMPSLASPGKKYDVDGQKTCSSALNFENWTGMKHTCVSQSRFAYSRQKNSSIWCQF